MSNIRKVLAEDQEVDLVKRLARYPTIKLRNRIPKFGKERHRSRLLFSPIHWSIYAKSGGAL